MVTEAMFTGITNIQFTTCELTTHEFRNFRSHYNEANPRHLRLCKTSVMQFVPGFFKPLVKNLGGVFLPPLFDMGDCF